MAEKIEKSVFAITFKSQKFAGESDKTLHIVALDFNEAIKKAQGSSDSVKANKEDVVEIIKAEYVCSIDIE